MAIYFDLDDNGVDFDDLQLLEKTMLVGFICLLVGVTALHLYVRLVRRESEALTQARYLIQLSLTFGSVVTALFTNLVFAVMIFKQHSHGLNCTTVKLARVYADQFLPVVYGCGLVLVAVDVIKRSETRVLKTTTPSNNIIFSCFIAAVPWIMALLVVCPLTLTNIDWEKLCHNNQSKVQNQVGIIVCGMVPAGMALGASLCAFFMRTGNDASHYTFDSPMYDDNYNTQEIQQALPEQYNTKNPYVLKLQNFQSNSSSTDPDDSCDCDNQLDYAPASVKNKMPSGNIALEKIVLLVACVVFVITEVPVNAMALYVTEHNDRIYLDSFIFKVSDFDFILYTVLFWSRGLYAVILPLVWLVV